MTSIGNSESVRGNGLEVYITTKNENKNFNDLGFVVDLINETKGNKETLTPVIAGSNLLKGVKKKQVVTFCINIKFK